MTRSMRTYFLLVIAFSSIFVPISIAQEIRVAAAADLQFALNDLAAQSTLSRYGFTLPAGVAAKSTKS